MANLVLQNVAACEINNTFVVTVTKMSVDGDQPVTVKFGAQGSIGSAVGFEKVTGTLELAVPVTGLEIDVVGALNDPKGFTFSFPIGSEKHCLFGAKRNKRSFSNTPETGESTFSFAFTATEWIRVK